MPIRLTPKARVAILSGLVAHMARSDLTPICMVESGSTQAAEHHEPARAGLLGANRIGTDGTTRRGAKSFYSRYEQTFC